MAYLIFGLFVFLGVHSVRIFADDWRTQAKARMGEQAFKGAYSVLSLMGFGLVIWGFGMARETPVLLWLPPVGMRHAAALFNVLAFVLLVAAYVPGNAIKARVHHPMVLGVKTWAFAHLLANGNLAHMVLFGAFLAWAVLDFISLRRRDRAQGIQYPAGTLSATMLTVLLGVVLAAVFALWVHGLLMGVKPFG
ncbi:protein NrnU [Rhodoferax lacus]|uniref:Protein NrnU n=1 Tax=Rhodoferax lacus TaxID=2184758 RepID=A0A3E1R8U1_9BURK|nr:NnrU family protein [Rhodoferax lacus]RFO95641.1 protein NrnU [Rhodoferax lacus]